MDILEIENKVAEIRGRPLQVIGVTPTGKAKIMGVRECWESGAKYLQIANDELDGLLGIALGGDNDALAENRQKTTDNCRDG